MKDFFSKCDQNPQFPADLITFTEEILNENFIFCAVSLLYSILFRPVILSLCLNLMISEC